MSYTIPHWHRFAACRDEDPDLFFPVAPGDGDKARRICAACLVSADCLRWAMDRPESHGVWGGYDEEERRQLRRNMLRSQRRRAA